mgnify:CR=1 FL=1
MSKIIGIDLGTTNSAVAFMELGNPKIIENAEGVRTTPSVVAISKAGERLVGLLARRQGVTNPKNTVFGIKRFIGHVFDDPAVQKDKTVVPFEVLKGPTGGVEIKIADKNYRPEEISAMILQKLKADAEAKLGEKITEAIITVPAYFNDAQRQATKDAGRIAGLDVKRIINEPTAAALAYGIDKQGKEKTIAVFDLGGGTFDVSILELGDGVFEVKSTDGDTHLGGDDFDQKIINWLAEEFIADENIDLRKDPMALQRLKEAAEKAKIELSSSNESEINLPYIMPVDGIPKHLVRKLTKAKFEQLCDDLIKRTLEPCKRALKNSGLSLDKINEVILVGGSTRIPRIQEEVEKFLWDFKPLLQEFKMWTKVPKNYARNTVLMGDLFQYQSNGDGELNLDEITEYGSLILGAMNVGDKIVTSLKQACAFSGTEADPHFDIACVRPKFFNILFDDLKLRPNLTRLDNYLSGINDKQKMQYMESVEKFGRDFPDDSLPLDTREVYLILGSFLSIESTMLRFDTDLNNRVDPVELERAYGVFRNGIIQIADLKTDELKFTHSIFIYMVKYMTIPTKKNLAIFHYNPFNDKTVTAHRLNIGSVSYTHLTLPTNREV